ncbi:MAG: hypothetical protein SFU98_01045 [Leptospiraceae bacterium]|nr:hypothetical protein [Leptospiraceae bacterium]
MNRIIIIILLLFSDSIFSREVYLFPGGKFIFDFGKWEEKRDNHNSYELLENGRDADWILLYDESRQMHIKLPVLGGQAYFSPTKDRNNWKILFLIKKETGFIDKNKKGKIIQEEDSPKQEEFTSCISELEAALIRTIAIDRARKKLTPISLSQSLTRVSKAHLLDLEKNPPAENCTLESWSKSESWTECCHDLKEEKPKKCSLPKPKELTDYKTDGIEILYTSEKLKAHELFQFFKESTLINSNSWKAIGVSIRGNRASIWLGESEDPKPSPGVCN